MIKKILETTENKSISIALLMMRMMFGLGMAIGHGKSKFLKFFAEEPLSFGDPIHLGEIPSLFLTVSSEFFSAILLAFGIFTRFVAIPLIITMIVAAFIVHAGDPFGRIEKALMYLTVYICLLITGAGKYSFDFWLSSRRQG